MIDDCRLIHMAGNLRKRYSRFASANNGDNTMKDEQPATKTTNILVVDDEESIRSLLRRILEKNGYHCITVSDVKEARTSMKETHFDLLLSDIKMPGESGIDLIRSVRTKYPDTAVVMVTVIDEQETAKTVLKMGIYGYIIKPFDENQILISIANALRRQELEMRERRYREDLERAVFERTEELTRSNEQLKTKKAELHRQTEELNELNSALSVLLKKREQDKDALEEKVLCNIKRVAVPYIEKLKQSRLNDEQITCLNILGSNLNDIVSSFAKELSSKYLALSPTEIQVAVLIKEGKQTKEIADILNLSTHTIVSHRYKIRSKLGLKNKRVNLRAYLRTIK
jgi:DNA-binding NarL/FixJ family response regulator